MQRKDRFSQRGSNGLALALRNLLTRCSYNPTLISFTFPPESGLRDVFPTFGPNCSLVWKYNTFGRSIASTSTSLSLALTVASLVLSKNGFFSFKNLRKPIKANRKKNIYNRFRFVKDYFFIVEDG